MELNDAKDWGMLIGAIVLGIAVLVGLLYVMYMIGWLIGHDWLGYLTWEMQSAYTFWYIVWCVTIGAVSLKVQTKD